MKSPLTILGLAVLLAAFAGASVSVLRRTARETDPTQITLRMCHWQLEGGLRDAFDAIGREYTALHPKVRITQLAVPGKMYGTYVQTQLTGDEPPDLMEIGGVPDEWLASYFTPLTPWVEKPNPYNQGTELEKLPWRDTFLDGLSKAPGLDTMQDYYSVPNTLTTVRMYFNRTLYREVMGHDTPPQTYDQYLEVCRNTRAFAAKTGRVLFPLAGSRFNATMFLDRLFRSQTQRAGLERDPLGALTSPGVLAYLGNRTTLDDPAVRSGLELMRDSAREMPPGFLQFDRDDAIFHFTQGRALMIATGSWDYRGIESQAPFPLGVFPLPMPGTDHPKFGRYTLGPAAEAGSGAGVYFFLSARSKHAAEAIDFLQFLTSQRGNQRFVDHAKWLPAVRGVKPPAEVAAFTPAETGYPDGFNIAPIMWGSGEVYRVQSNHLHHLVDPAGSVEAFAAAMRPEFAAAVRADIQKQSDSYRDNVRRQDTTLAAIGHAAYSPEERQRRRASLLETQNTQELLNLWLERELKTWK